MSEPHDLPVLYRGPDGARAGLHFDPHFDPSDTEALPQQTFATSYEFQANGEALSLCHFAPAHTDSDIYVYFQKASVIQMGDTFFNGMYPHIDPGTGGNKITGMIAASDKNSFARRQLHQDCSGARPARQQDGPHEIPRHAHHFARSRSEIEVHGKIRSGSRRGKASPISTPSGAKASSTATSSSKSSI